MLFGCYEHKNPSFSLLSFSLFALDTGFFGKKTYYNFLENIAECLPDGTQTMQDFHEAVTAVRSDLGNFMNSSDQLDFYPFSVCLSLPSLLSISSSLLPLLHLLSLPLLPLPFPPSPFPSLSLSLSLPRLGSLSVSGMTAVAWALLFGDSRIFGDL